VDAAYQAAATAFKPGWSKLPGRGARQISLPHRPHASGARASSPWRKRSTAARPIKESRDFDLPMAAAHFFYHAGWADKLDYAFPRPHARATRRRRAGDSVEFSRCSCSRGKSLPALACGNTVVLKPAETTSDHRAEAGAILTRSPELPEGVVNIVTGAGETGAAVVNHPDAAKIAFTGSTEVGKRIMRRRSPAPARSSRSNSAARRRTFCSRTRRLIRPSKASSTASYFNQGHVCCAGSRLFVQEGIWPTVIKKLRDRIQTSCASAIRSTKTPTSARSIRGRSSKIRELVQSGVDEGAELTQPAMHAPGKRVSISAVAFHGRHARASRRVARRSSARCCP
jgi:aldehyde dehydrogenase (NAD+)